MFVSVMFSVTKKAAEELCLRSKKVISIILLISPANID